MRFSYSILFLGLWLTGQCWVPGVTSYPKPSISVHPSETVALGGTVNIRCKNEEPYKPISEDTQMEFHLQKQTSSEFEMWRTEVAEHDEVVFPFDNVAPSDAGIYRCIYCYKTYTCQAWSRYSERVNISIRGQIHPKSSTPVNAREKSYNDGFPVKSSTIIWAGAAAGSLVLILLLLLLAFVMYRKRKRGSTAHERTQPLPMKETNLEEVVAGLQPRDPIQPQCNPKPLKPESEGEAEDDPDGVSYAVLNHHSLKRQEAAKLESISESCVYASVANGRSRKGL